MAAQQEVPNANDPWSSGKPTQSPKSVAIPRILTLLPILNYDQYPILEMYKKITSLEVNLP